MKTFNKKKKGGKEFVKKKNQPYEDKQIFI